MDVVLALSDTATALVVAGVGLVGALVGGAATFAATWWERRSQRRADDSLQVRDACERVLDSMTGLFEACLKEPVDLADRARAKLDLTASISMLSLYPPTAATLAREIEAITVASDMLLEYGFPEPSESDATAIMNASGALAMFGVGAGRYVVSLR